MACKNPKCDRQQLTEEQLIKATIKELESINISHELAEKLDIRSNCALCANFQIATWLRDYLVIKQKFNL